jgi:mRNA interferase MazF
VAQNYDPAVMLADTSLDLTVCFITTQVGWQEATDVLVTPTTTNGLRKPSLIRTSKIATLDRTLAKEVSELNTKLKLLFQLP